MSPIRSTLKVALVAIAVSPTFALAGSPWHDAGSEPGATYFPGHGVTPTAGETRVGLDAARADGARTAVPRRVAVPPDTATDPRFRVGVQRGVLGTTQRERDTFDGIYVGY